MHLWKLPSGTPPNEPYITDYLRAVFHNVCNRLGTNIRNVKQAFR